MDPRHIRETAREAVQGLGHDLLIVCGFAFAPPSTGKIAVKVINHYGDEVLKVFTV